MGMLMILREEYYKYILHMKSEDSNKINGSTHVDDPFFTNNYNKQGVDALLKSYKKPETKNQTMNVVNGKFSLNN
jgi:hypothetical protein